MKNLNYVVDGFQVVVALAGAVYAFSQANILAAVFAVAYAFAVVNKY